MVDPPGNWSPCRRGRSSRCRVEPSETYSIQSVLQGEVVHTRAQSNKAEEWMDGRQRISLDIQNYDPRPWTLHIPFSANALHYGSLPLLFQSWINFRSAGESINASCPLSPWLLRTYSWSSTESYRPRGCSSDTQIHSGFALQQRLTVGAGGREPTQLLINRLHARLPSYTRVCHYYYAVASIDQGKPTKLQARRILHIAQPYTSLHHPPSGVMYVCTWQNSGIYSV